VPAARRDLITSQHGAARHGTPITRVLTPTNSVRGLQTPAPSSAAVTSRQTGLVGGSDMKPASSHSADPRETDSIVAITGLIHHIHPTDPSPPTDNGRLREDPRHRRWSPIRRRDRKKKLLSSPCFRKQVELTRRSPCHVSKNPHTALSQVLAALGTTRTVKRTEPAETTMA
jgi:hypothetical protein